MSTKRLTEFITTISRNPWARVMLLSIYYFAIIAGLILMYGEGSLAAPEFVYQGF
jgi:hypothetical protein